MAASCKLQQNANDEGCNSCASLVGLVACFIVLVVVIKVILMTDPTLDKIKRAVHSVKMATPEDDRIRLDC